MRITWLGHATVLIEIDGVRLLTDPVLGGRVGPLVRIAPPVHRDQLESIDGVLLSHLHADHADPSSLRSVAREAPVVAPAGSAAWLCRRGLLDVRELSAGSELRIGAVEIAATEAAHDARRWPVGVSADPLGFIVRGSRSVYFAGDTDVFAAMSELRGRVDAALLPVWGWGPSVGPGHLDPGRAAEAAAMIAPAVAIPIHWGTFALAWAAARGSADPARPAREFAALVGRSAPDVEVRVLEPGEHTEL
jgi:L-ascorbate metabolism protein UlaG (beta-lactamase superfamily)